MNRITVRGDQWESPAASARRLCPRGPAMQPVRCPVLLHSPFGRVPAGIDMPVNAEPGRIALRLREAGWIVKDVRYDVSLRAWIASLATVRLAA